MEFKIITAQSPEYDKMIVLRYEILRKPLGLSFSKEDIEQEKDDLFCICQENNEILGCCAMTKQSETILKLRQMAVDTKQQGKGIGAKILLFAEKTAISMGYEKITFHARAHAEKFYSKYGYIPVGEQFIEVTIPHIEMEKKILL